MYFYDRLSAILNKIFMKIKFLTFKKEMDQPAVNPLFKQIMVLLFQVNIEDSLMLYARNHPHIKQDIKKTYKFFSSRPVQRYFQNNIKDRYYEFLISLASNAGEKKFANDVYMKFDKKFSNSLHGIKHLLKLNKANEDFFIDRVEEYKILFKTNILPSIRKEDMFKQFTPHIVSDDKSLYDALKNITPHYFLRRMLLPNFKDFYWIEKYKWENKAYDILDYGCGSADMSLYFAKTGNHVTLCDIEGGNLDYAQKRFDIRGLRYQTLRSMPENPIPVIHPQYDIIIAVEVIEHVRNPLELLKRFNNQMKAGGIIVLGSFPYKQTNVYGDHLQESVFKKKELLSWIEKKWQRIDLGNFNHVLMKAR